MRPILVPILKTLDGDEGLAEHKTLLFLHTQRAISHKLVKVCYQEEEWGEGDTRVDAWVIDGDKEYSWSWVNNFIRDNEWEVYSLTYTENSKQFIIED